MGEPLILFKILVLRKLFNSIDAELNFQVNVKPLFGDFVGLGVMNSILDETNGGFLSRTSS